MRELARRRWQPASVRLMDNDQFKFGLILKPAEGPLGLALDGLKRLYVTRVRGFDPDRMCVATLLFEGSEREVGEEERRVYGVAGRCGGVPAGEKNGERGYTLTFVIAYIRVSMFFIIFVLRFVLFQPNLRPTPTTWWPNPSPYESVSFIGSNRGLYYHYHQPFQDLAFTYNVIA